jgi:hypothetical protein
MPAGLIGEPGGGPNLHQPVRRCASVIPLQQTDLTELARIAVEASGREYPHMLMQELASDADVKPPRELHPSFYGSYDWHSAVHNHWLLVRLLARGVPHVDEVVARLDGHLSPQRLVGELAFYSGPGGRTAERPYGWAWLVLLHAECVALAAGDERCGRWAQALAPLARLLDERLAAYFGGSLAFPIRTGTHANSAFSLQLVLRAARRRGDEQRAAKLARDARRLFAEDDSLPWSEDPGGDAFLTAPLAEADLLADVLSPAELGAWLDLSLPDPTRAAWSPPAFSPDGDDPGTVHLEGLLTSRAWALDALAQGLPEAHPAATLARSAADAHLARVRNLRPGDGFNRAHWLPTFVLYLDERLRGTIRPAG